MLAPSFATGLWENLSHDIHYIWPQILLMVSGLLMLWPLDSWLLPWTKAEKHKWAIPTMAILLLSLAISVYTPNGLGFSAMYKVDGLTKGFQVLCILASIFAVMLSQKVLGALFEHTAEYYALILFATSGMLFMCGAVDLVTIYFSIELMALCIYILVAYLRNQERGIEAGMKYFLLGAFSSGILLYGISLLFAATGGITTNLTELNQKLAVVSQDKSLLVYSGALMVLVGLCFKVAAVPFHMWSPDVYDGAPTPITAWLATAPKAASLAVFLRIFGTGFHSISYEWEAPLMLIAGATMILGNVAAIKQQSMKRLLAYSSIAHVGYMLLGVLSKDAQAGAQAIWLYMLLYLFMNTGAFAVVIYLQGKNEGERIEDFSGMGKRHPVLAFSMLVFLLSLAGIPPFIGFFGKFYLFLLAVEQGYTTLVVIALLTSAVSAFYYLEVVKQMYFKEPAEGEVAPMDSYSKFLISTTCAVVIIGTAFGPQLLKWTDDIRWFEKETPAAVMEFPNK
ncbi:MAG: NADH-quinone oxidoreductase subunit N [Holophagaceae bacterium]|nr:NADH-quinone oxidoreductase subunit N [Holophagaceae bacterium]